MLRFFILCMMTITFVGCAHPRMTLVKPVDQYFQRIFPNSTVQVRLGKVIDKRPEAEINGVNFKKPAGGNFFVLGGRGYSRGTKYYPGRAMGNTIADAFRIRLEQSLVQSGMHSPTGSLKYRVDAEIQHFTGINYETQQSVMLLPLFGANRVQFSKDYGLCAVLLKIYDQDGDLVSQVPVSYRRRNTNLRAYDVPDWESREQSLASLLGVTIEKAIRALGGIIVSDLAKRSSLSTQAFISPIKELNDEGIFQVHRVLKDSSRTEFVAIKMKTGDVVSRYTGFYVDAGGIPGHWYLSAHTRGGIRLPRGLYKEIADRVSQKFNIQRVDDVMLYRFYGENNEARN